MTNKTLREQAIEKIDNAIKERCHFDYDGYCTAFSPAGMGKEIMDILESLGYVPPDKVIKVIGNEIEYFIEVSALEKWVESRGYVQKAKDQNLPDGISNLEDWTPEDVESHTWKMMLTPDKNGCVWVKVEKELK
jgi:hypothetical protein